MNLFMYILFNFINKITNDSNWSVQDDYMNWNFFNIFIKIY